jgi:MBG domain (YGX type)
VTAVDKSRTYGAANPTFTATITGVVNGETIAVVSGSPTFSGTGPSSTATTVVGDYVITPAVGTLSATNYDFTSFVNGALHITQATLTITATNRSKVFGATYTPNTTTPPTDFTVTGLLNIDTVTSITLTCAGYAAAALPSATPYPVVPSAAMGTGLGNYNIGYVNGQFTIGYGNCTDGYVNAQIQQPINTDGSSVFKQGNTVPVKFTVCGANGQPISDPAAVFPSAYGSVNMINTVRGTVNQVNETNTYDIPDSAFRWSSDKWIFNISTSNLLKNNTYNFRIYLKDGSFIAFTIGTK